MFDNVGMFDNVDYVDNVDNVNHVNNVNNVDNVDNVDNIDTTFTIDTVEVIWNNNLDGFCGYPAIQVWWLTYGLSNMGLRDASASKNTKEEQKQT